jgi:EAL domain
VPIGSAVMRQACREASGSHDACPGGADLRLTVNVSARQAAEPALVEMVAGTLRDSGLEPQCLGIEITERTMMEEATGSGDTLAQLRDLGVRLVIDDFGTGYSSLAYLPRPLARRAQDRLLLRRRARPGRGQRRDHQRDRRHGLGARPARDPRGHRDRVAGREAQAARLPLRPGLLLSPPVKADEKERMLSAESVPAEASSRLDSRDRAVVARRSQGRRSACYDGCAFARSVV